MKKHISAASVVMLLLLELKDPKVELANPPKVLLDVKMLPGAPVALVQLREQSHVHVQLLNVMLAKSKITSEELKAVRFVKDNWYWVAKSATFQ
jgi:hypothetical protein